MGDAVTVEYGGGVIEITINRPEARNALNGAVRAGVTEGARAFAEKRAPQWKGR
jgi:enoyl-CoA hydratase/carnithine racemase